MKLLDNNEIEYVYEPINKDCYLKNLAKSIKKDKDINKITFSNKIYSLNEVYKSLNFFENNNLLLHEVLLNKDGDILYDHPAEISIFENYLTNNSETIINYKDNNEYIDYINLAFNLRKDTLISYIHEITHTQASAFNNIIIKDDANEEVLPIFLEQVAAMQSNNYNYLYSRLKELAYDIDMLDKVDNELDKYIFTTYIKSTLKALNLFNIYNNSNDNIKKEIMYFIQGIFDEYYSLEEVLKKYEINYNNSKKKLIELKHI